MKIMHELNPLFSFQISIDSDHINCPILSRADHYLEKFKKVLAKIITLLDLAF